MAVHVVGVLDDRGRERCSVELRKGLLRRVLAVDLPRSVAESIAAKFRQGFEALKCAGQGRTPGPVYGGGRPG